VGAPAVEDAPTGEAPAVLKCETLEPVTPIRDPPRNTDDWDGCRKGPPQRQQKIGKQAKQDKEHPEDLSLHEGIVCAYRKLRLSFRACCCYTRAMQRTLKEVADYLGARLIGEAQLEVSGVASVQAARPGDLVFVEDARYVKKTLESKATAVIAGEFALQKSKSGKPFLVVAHPRLAFARAAEWLAGDTTAPRGIHTSAIVDPTAHLADGVCVEECAVIRAGVEIGANSRIGAGCVLGPNVQVGSNCRLYSNVTIYPGSTLGNRVIIHAGVVLGSDGFGFVRDPKTGKYEKFPQIGRLIIEDDVEIGANSTVDRGALDVTRIRRGTKIDNLVHVGHNVQIGEDVVIAAQTGLSGSAIVGRNVIIGGQVGVADHVRIEEGAILGAQSGIPSKKVIRGRGVVFWGTPARPIRQYLKELAVLARLRKKE
jgi:UDP-3-O-[3-hydroxymyristoyl] glucosamine N-acyltransferase